MKSCQKPNSSIPKVLGIKRDTSILLSSCNPCEPKAKNIFFQITHLITNNLMFSQCPFRKILLKE